MKRAATAAVRSRRLRLCRPVEPRQRLAAERATGGEIFGQKTASIEGLAASVIASLFRTRRLRFVGKPLPLFREEKIWCACVGRGTFCLVPHSISDLPIAFCALP